MHLPLITCVVLLSADAEFGLGDLQALAAAVTVWKKVAANCAGADVADMLNWSQSLMCRNPTVVDRRCCGVCA